MNGSFIAVGTEQEIVSISTARYGWFTIIGADGCCLASGVVGSGGQILIQHVSIEGEWGQLFGGANLNDSTLANLGALSKRICKHGCHDRAECVE